MDATNSPIRYSHACKALLTSPARLWWQSWDIWLFIAAQTCLFGLDLNPGIWADMPTEWPRDVAEAIALTTWQVCRGLLSWSRSKGYGSGNSISRTAFNFQQISAWAHIWLVDSPKHPRSDSSTSSRPHYMLRFESVIWYWNKQKTNIWWINIDWHVAWISKGIANILSTAVEAWRQMISTNMNGSVINFETET